MNDVPALGHELCASGYSEIAEYAIQSHGQEVIDKTEIKAEKENCHDDHDGCAHDFLTPRPRNFLHFAPNIGVKLLCVLDPVFNFFCRIHE